MKSISPMWVIKNKTTITNKEQAVELWIEIKIISKIAQVPLISKLMESINILILKLVQVIWIMGKILVRNTNLCNKRRRSQVLQENSLLATILMALIVRWFSRILLNYQMERNKTWDRIMTIPLNKRMGLPRYIRKKK